MRGETSRIPFDRLIATEDSYRRNGALDRRQEGYNSLKSIGVEAGLKVITAAIKARDLI